jgi:type IV secretion/conjugal transfer VirB4 family ATPase
MLSLKKIVKNYQETGALNENIGIVGFVDETTFITKAGDVGTVLHVEGVDYECLDSNETENLAKRLESALKLFDSKFRIYQYLFKTSSPAIPHTPVADEVARAAVDLRLAYFQTKAPDLYSLNIYYAILYEGFRHQSNFLQAMGKLLSSPGAAWDELKGLLSSEKQIVFVLSEIEKAQRILRQRTENFILQVNDFVNIRLLGKSDAYQVLRKFVNFAPEKRAPYRLKYDSHVDFFMCDSSLECYPTHLQVDDFYVKVLTWKEPTAQSWPLILKQLYEVEAGLHVVTEWRPRPNAEARKKIQSARRHFHNSKTSLMSQIRADNSPNAADVLVDDSKESLVRNLGECLNELELKGNYFGEFSLTVVVYDQNRQAVERACGEIYKVFSVNDGSLYSERYNLLNAFFATIPGNQHFNLRRMDVLNTNYADYSFLFTLHTGEQWNKHLDREYLAILETNHSSPYFFNLHYQDTAHTLITGRTGSGKSFLLNFLIANMQKYEPHTFIFDLGGSFKSITQLFGGSYLKVGITEGPFTINPFSLEPTAENLNFLFSFVKVLIEGKGQYRFTHADDKEVYEQIDNLYQLPADLRTLDVLSNTLRKDLADKLHKWTLGGQYATVFNNAHDTLTFSRFQCFDFEGMDQYAEVIEPLLFYILHRASAAIYDPAISTTFKAFFMDEAWRFFSHPVIRSYIVEALKTWRKKNAAMVLATQSLDELRKSEILDVVLESCGTKIFLANPALDTELYRNTFHLNDNEIEFISGLIPKRQLFIKRPDMAKVLNLSVDDKSYWLYTNDPNDNQRRDEAFRKYGFLQGLEVLARSKRI